MKLLGYFNPAEARTMRDMVYRALRKAIFEEELKAGDRLVETKLAEMMGVSRTPVREALQKLETEGLVKHLPRRGVVVQGIQIEDVIEIYAIREALETAAVSFIVDHITPAEKKELFRLLDEMKQLAKTEGIEELFQKSQEFNELLLRSSKMPRLINLVNTYKEYLTKFRKVTMSKEPRKFDALSEHEAILRAIDRRDIREAQELMRHHINRARWECLKMIFKGL